MPPTTSSPSNKSKAPKVTLHDEELITPVEDSFNTATTATTPPSTSRPSKKSKTSRKAVSYIDSPTQLAAAAAEEAEEEDEILSSADVANESPDTIRKWRPRNSPFDAWQRTKGSAAGSSVGKKRAGDAVEEDSTANGGGKRTRGAV